MNTHVPAHVLSQIPTAQPVNTHSPNYEPTATPTPSSADLRVNIGGPDYIDSTGKIWYSDSALSGSYFFWEGNVGGMRDYEMDVDGLVISDPLAAITNTSDPALYRDARYWNYGMGMKFLVPNGRYKVVLKFAELNPAYAYAGSRSLTINVHTVTCTSSFDLFTQAGLLTAYDVEMPEVDTADGSLFILIRGAAILNALYIKQMPAGSTVGSGVVTEIIE